MEPINVGDLLDFITKNNIPLDVKICYERIEDKYFDGIDISGMSGCDYTEDHIFPEGSKADGWDTIKVKDESYYYALLYNKKIKEAKEAKEKGLDLDDFAPFFLRDDVQEIDLNDESIFDHYIESQTIFYDKENNILCITAHY